MLAALKVAMEKNYVFGEKKFTLNDRQMLPGRSYYNPCPG
jgi:hypothetical protein